MFQSKKITLVRDLDLDFLGLLPGVGACEAGARFVDGLRRLARVPGFAVVAVAAGGGAGYEEGEGGEEESESGGVHFGDGDDGWKD